MKKLTEQTSKLIMFISIFTILYGCSNENTFDTSDNFQDQEKEDFHNPYDFVGEYHNEGLLYVFSKLEKDFSTNTRSLQMDQKSQATNITDTTHVNKIKQIISSYSNEYPLTYKGKQYPFIRCYPTPLSQISPSTRSFTFQYTINVQNYLTEFENLITSPTDIYSIDDFMQAINEIEQEIYNSDMSEEEKTILLLSYAVGKYSFQFWTNIADKRISAPIAKTRSESFADWWSQHVTPVVYSIVKSDFAGAATGALEGLITGASGGSVVAPGPGTVTGGVAGAVGGAATGAVYGSVIDGILYYFITD